MGVQRQVEEARPVTISPRGRTYATIVAVVGAMLAVGLALPFVLGDPASSLATGSGSERPDGGLDAEFEETTSTTLSGSEATVPAIGGPGATSPTVVERGPLRATDRGVTADTVTAGVLIPDAGAVQRTGFTGEGADPETQRQVWQALERSVNADGGIEGRRLHLVFASYNPLAADSMRAACLELTQDRKVFAVLNITAFYGDPVLCVTEQNKTPLVLDPGQSQEYYERSPGLLFTTGMSRVRLLQGAVAALDDAGRLDGRRIGILEGSAADNVQATDDGFVAELERRGHKVAKRVTLGELGVAQTQIPLAVNQLKAAGVDLLLVMHNPIIVTSFVQQATAQGFNPTYLGTDMGLMTSDLATQNMPDSFDGAIGITVTRTNEHRQNLPEPQVDRTCIDRVIAQGMARPERGSPRANTMLGACAVLDAFLAGARAAGPELTRVRFGPAMSSVGPVDLAARGASSFTQGKPDAPDEIRPLIWKASCKCWLPNGAFVRTP